MNNKEFGKNLEDRTLKFALRVIHLSTMLPNTQEGRVVRNQFTKAGTSVEANYREANRARSRADFVHKMKICVSEASETVYWIKIISEQKWGAKEEIQFLLIEANELIGIFVSAGQKLKNQAKKKL